MGEADCTLYESFFEITTTLCKIFPALDPFTIRRTRAREVFILINRLKKKPKNKKKAGQIRRPAGDTWF